MAILTEMRDPRVKNVTVLFVEVPADLRSAKVHVSVMGTEKEQKLTMIGLKNSAGFLQSKIANRIDMRYTPKLEFILDEGVKKSLEVSRILKEVNSPKSETEDGSDLQTEQAEQPDSSEQADHKVTEE